MKKSLALMASVLVILSILSLTACKPRPTGIIIYDDYYTEEFMGLFRESRPEYAHLEYDKCCNVTPQRVEQETEYMIFKFLPNDESYVLADGEVYELCASFGGHGFLNAVPWDYDGNGVTDLLVASSWGSGIHRGEITVFDMTAKESVSVYSSFDDGRFDMCVTEESGRYLARIVEDFEYDTNYNIKSYTAGSVIGEVTAENGGLTFKRHFK